MQCEQPQDVVMYDDLLTTWTVERHIALCEQQTLLPFI